MPRFTVRLDDDVATKFALFTTEVGISTQAALEASITLLVERYDENDRSVPEDWSEQDRAKAFIALARRIDAEHRKRA